ncbi:antibiotic biosynthesis monooxygenase [Kaistia nematophila]|uniref:Antibiotic biosynthesis monooxygenase n=1 Tax=Kaistia nematophila TaxID=2994654 RepID=A0A9X3E6W4_9HYPH|nr:antibiotic biosynthesis monooxygenase [Kaistia nematophila]MCX5571822.1 antibiotic biosynthesis monooxygenase [Kaistia nematophila]
MSQSAIRSPVSESSANQEAPALAAGPLYRVDKFIVPAAGRDEFLGRVRDTYDVLRQQEGFLQDMILEQNSGPGVFNIVTLVEWASADVVARVSEAVARHHAETGFDRQAMIARLGITADIASYSRIPAF